MSVSPEEVCRIAALARLSFTPEEQQRLAVEMSAILHYMDQLDELDTSGVEPLLHVLDLQNVFREDSVRPRILHEDALRNAPDHDGTFFRVPKVIE